MRIATYLQRNSGEPLSPLIAAMAFMGAVAFVALYQVSDSGAAMAFGGLVIALLILHRIEVLPALFLLYAALTDDNFEMSGHFLYPTVYYWQLNIPLVLGIALLLLLDRMIERVRTPGRLEERESSPRTDVIGIMVLLLSVWLLFELLLGIGNGNKPSFAVFDYAHFFLFSSYLVWVALFRQRGNTVGWLAFLVLTAVLASLQVILFVMTAWQGIMSFIFERVYTRQGQLSFPAIPLLMAFFLTEKKKSFKWLIAGGLLLVMIQVLAIQQRSMWVADAISVIIFFSLYSFRHGWTIRGLHTWLIGAGGILVLGLVILLIAAYGFGVNLDILLTRWRDFGTLYDPSTKMRYFDIQYALREFSRHPFLGGGLGTTIYSVTNAQYRYGIDNSYVLVLAKGGIPCFLLFISIFFGGLKQAWDIFRKAADERIQLVGAALFCALFGAMLGGAANPAIVYWHYVLVWMMLIAATTVIRETMRVKEGKQ